MILGGQRRGAHPVAGELADDATTVRAAYRALEAGDGRAASRHLDPRITWVHPAVGRLPFDGVRRGLPAVLRAAFRRDGNGEGPRISAGTFVELGDGVLVAGRFGEEAPFLHECFVEGGRIVRIREYPKKP